MDHILDPWYLKSWTGSTGQSRGKVSQTALKGQMSTKLLARWMPHHPSLPAVSTQVFPLQPKQAVLSTHTHIAQHSPCTLFIRAPDIEAFSLPISLHAKFSVETRSIHCLKLTHTIHEAGIIYLHFVDIFLVNAGKNYHTWMLWII